MVNSVVAVRKRSLTNRASGEAPTVGAGYAPLAARSSSLTRGGQRQWRRRSLERPTSTRSTGSGPTASLLSLVCFIEDLARATPLAASDARRTRSLIGNGVRELRNHYWLIRPILWRALSR